MCSCPDAYPVDVVKQKSVILHSRITGKYPHSICLKSELHLSSHVTFLSVRNMTLFEDPAVKTFAHHLFRKYRHNGMKFVFAICTNFVAPRRALSGTTTWKPCTTSRSTTMARSLTTRSLWTLLRPSTSDNKGHKCPANRSPLHHRSASALVVKISFLTVCAACCVLCF